MSHSMADDFLGTKLTLSYRSVLVFVIVYVQSPTEFTRFHLNKTNGKKKKTAGDR